MPWKEASTMSLRLEFVTLAKKENVNIRSLCTRFGISPKTGYKWLRRFDEGGEDSLSDRPRRPHHNPNRTSPEVEQLILESRDRHPAWGPRKLHTLLSEPDAPPLPAISTLAQILKRNDRIQPEESLKHKAWQRFEAEAPNDLWQMDFKGHFPLANAQRCHPLTVLDDHSRFLLGLRACLAETWPIVKLQLTSIFQRYGLPRRMIFDNGAPWGSCSEHRYTPLSPWLILLGISISHSRARHPQTLGKDERLHRTLKLELLKQRVLEDVEDSQRAFDEWREVYNFRRPHEAISMTAPASRYEVSKREFPSKLADIEYGPDYSVRKVQEKGEVRFHNREFKVSKAFRGYPVGLRPTTTDGLYDVYFCHQPIAQINLKHDTSNVASAPC